jgi:hypothetical protein
VQLKGFKSDYKQQRWWVTYKNEVKSLKHSEHSIN